MVLYLLILSIIKHASLSKSVILAFSKERGWIHQEKIARKKIFVKHWHFQSIKIYFFLLFKRILLNSKFKIINDSDLFVFADIYFNALIRRVSLCSFILK